MKPITMAVTQDLANALRREARDETYWDAVAQIKFAIADLLGIPRWNESWMERTLAGDASAPISIIQFKEYEKN